jgi:hypothetical protein
MSFGHQLKGEPLPRGHPQKPPPGGGHVRRVTEKEGTRSPIFLSAARSPAGHAARSQEAYSTAHAKNRASG